MLLLICAFVCVHHVLDSAGFVCARTILCVHVCVCVCACARLCARACGCVRGCVCACVRAVSGKFVGVRAWVNDRGLARNRCECVFKYSSA